MINSIWAKVKDNAVVKDSVVNFPTKTRLHIALNVMSVNDVINFYRLLFGTEPHTIREGYIKFDLDEPPLNISLNEVPKNAKGNGKFGLQAKSEQHIFNIEARLNSQNIPLTKEQSSMGGFRVKDPEGNEWLISLPK